MAEHAVPTVTMTVQGPIERAGLPALTARVCALFANHPGFVVSCDVGDVIPDAVTVEALSRLQLAARRYGCQVRIRNGSTELRELVALMGLTDVLPEP